MITTNNGIILLLFGTQFGNIMNYKYFSHSCKLFFINNNKKFESSIWLDFEFY